MPQPLCVCTHTTLWYGFAVAQMVEGIVLDVGWYRTTIRSFEREIYNIPNSVFSRNVVLNITRKNKEWRFYESIGALPEADPGGALAACGGLLCTVCCFGCKGRKGLVHMHAS